MERDIAAFLHANRKKSVWVATHAGIFEGIVESVNGMGHYQTVLFSECRCYSMFDASVTFTEFVMRIDDIFGWGCGHKLHLYGADY